MAVKQFDRTFPNCKDGEPVFVLRGQDVLAPMVVEYWAELAAKLRVDPSKILEAYRCSQAMKDYPNRKLPD